MGANPTPTEDRLSGLARAFSVKQTKPQIERGISMSQPVTPKVSFRGAGGLESKPQQNNSNQNTLKVESNIINTQTKFKDASKIILRSSFNAGKSDAMYEQVDMKLTVKTSPSCKTSFNEKNRTSTGASPGIVLPKSSEDSGISSETGEKSKNSPNGEKNDARKFSFTANQPYSQQNSNIETNESSKSNNFTSPTGITNRFTKSPSPINEDMHEKLNKIISNPPPPLGRMKSFSVNSSGNYEKDVISEENFATNKNAALRASNSVSENVHPFMRFSMLSKYNNDITSDGCEMEQPGKKETKPSYNHSTIDKPSTFKRLQKGLTVDFSI